MLLGAVVPEMRAKVEALASDLAELLRVRKQIAADATGLLQSRRLARQTSVRA